MEVNITVKSEEELEKLLHGNTGLPSNHEAVLSLILTMQKIGVPVFIHIEETGRTVKSTEVEQ